MDRNCTENCTLVHFCSALAIAKEPSQIKANSNEKMAKISKYNSKLHGVREQQ